MSKLKVATCLSYVKDVHHPSESVRTSFRNPQFYAGEVEKCDFVITTDKVIAENYSKAGVKLVETEAINVGTDSPQGVNDETGFDEELKKSVIEKYSKLTVSACDLIISENDIPVAEDAKVADKRKVISEHMYYVEMSKNESMVSKDTWN